MPRLAVVALALGACVAPQRPGAVRVTFISMATVDGAAIGAIASIAGCAVVGGGENAPDKLLTVCTAVGAIVGGTAMLYGALQTETEPGVEHWIVLPILPAFFVIGGIKKLFGR